MAEEKKQLHIEVRDKIATLTSQNFQLVGGNSDYEVVFDFDEAWDNYPVKTALFVFGNGSEAKPFEGKVCEGVAINNSTRCYIGVFSGDMVATTPAEVECVLQSITDIGGVPKDPTPSVYNEIIDLLNKYIEQGGGGGQSGFSPTVQITPIENGHRVTITDVNGSHSFDVMNGEKGEQGAQGGQGEKGADGYTPQKGTDYWTPQDVADIHSYIDGQISPLRAEIEGFSKAFDDLHQVALSYQIGDIEAAMEVLDANTQALKSEVDNKV